MDPVPPASTDQPIVTPPVPEMAPVSKPKSNVLVWVVEGIIVLGIGVGIGWFLGNNTKVPVSSYEECVEAKNSTVSLSYPATCVTRDGKRFIQPLTDEEKGGIQLPPDQNPDYKQLCMERGGLWLTEYLECGSESSPNLNSEWCTNLGGKFSECQSPCRHDPKFQLGEVNCIMVCTKVCQFK